jgi:mevalonate kinase
MIELFVPGRLCLFGEHSDWAGALRGEDDTVARGACIITGTDQGIHAMAEAAPLFEVVSHLPDGSTKGPFRVAMQAQALHDATRSAGFFSYAAGVAAEVQERYGVGGVRIEVDRMDLPLGRGLSSSAAICVLTARAFNRVHRLALSIREEMELAYRGEIATGSQCGRMDQACAYGNRLLLLEFDREHMTVAPLSPRARMDLLIVDLQLAKDTRRILADLRHHFLAQDSPATESLRHALGDANLELVERARAALEAGDARTVGSLMTEAQVRFDASIAPACLAELSAPRLHVLLERSDVRELTWGGKGVGSQGEGSAQFVCRGSEEQSLLAELLFRDLSVHCLPLTIAPQSRHLR